MLLVICSPFAADDFKAGLCLEFTWLRTIAYYKSIQRKLTCFDAWNFQASLEFCYASFNACSCLMHSLLRVLLPPQREETYYNLFLIYSSATDRSPLGWRYWFFFSFFASSAFFLTRNTCICAKDASQKAELRTKEISGNADVYTPKDDELHCKYVTIR